MSSKDDEPSNDATFHESLPRPPVPGKEQSHFVSDWGPPTLKQTTTEDAMFVKPSSPTPLQNYGSASNPTTSFKTASSQSQPSNPSSDAATVRSPPACLNWAKSLHCLFQDAEGVKLFRQYLDSECIQHSNALKFWFACEGLRKQQEVDKIMQLVRVIYRKFILKYTLPIPEDVREKIGDIVKSSECLYPPVTLYDSVQAQIENLLLTTTYPNFLKSDMYLQYVEKAQNSMSNESTSEFSTDFSNLASGVDLLPTLHEDVELVTNPMHMSYTSGSLSTGYHTPNIAASPVRLTKDILLWSQKRRAVDRSKSETFASLFAYRETSGSHAPYNSYNPVSRQDSELHSISSRSYSDARSESDNLSLTDSSVDGRPFGRTSRRQAALNREGQMNQIVIPRTQRVDKSQCQPMDPDKFASMLIEKLVMVKKDLDAQELLERKLREAGSLAPMSEQNIREKLLLDDENDQSILDDHVSLVFPDTPARSPGVTSPHKQKHLHPSRRRKDGSIFSNDSGNVQDFAEGSEHKCGMVKSKSMPEYSEDRLLRGAIGRRPATKKIFTDLTDSGVSVVSDGPPANIPMKDSRVVAWLMSGHNEMSAKQRSGSFRTSSATSPISNRHKKGFGSRSSSVERTSVTSASLADPSKATMSTPNTLTQLEEARRRLEDDVKARSKQRSSANRHFVDLAQSSQSTLRKSQRGTKPSLPTAQANDEQQITVVFSFCDEQFPYRTKIPGSQITLKQFKEYLPKKGNYRYFFKTVCEELGDQVIQEEVCNDLDTLPLYEGKVMAQVKPLD
ncbi:axin isoform X1 [Dendroctonus ponderosae]|uniref:axin isoform X1 n=1 Tax=Dendroctonus ponderosae TaxID=77166 RepID=UPI0020356DA1|nr:axin isoform X1 [Dendroctonus ponderosae]XP_019762014.2 axin isoform X1 [Dendroctonus ponderosae]XP_048519718.1 axin isoform X1 [Dendroctonus ponderosae]